MANVELTGALTIQSIEEGAGIFLRPIPTGEFGDINKLYTILQNRGSLTLRNATLTLPNDESKFFLAAHRLILINSKIYCNSSDMFFLCNEYEHSTSSFNSFSAQYKVAANGANGTSEGAYGTDGEDGEDGSNIYLFVTDKIKTNGGGVTINLAGQNGGNGGSGVRGAKGQKGSHGTNCRGGDLPGDCRRGCGNGGTGKTGQPGGYGGDAGNGGNGGRFEFRFHGTSVPPDYYFVFTSNGGKPGVAGLGAEGGEGGDGGGAGRSACRGCHGSCRPGAKGATGARGRNGADGREGEKKYLLNSNFDVQYLKLFMSSWVNELVPLSEMSFEFNSDIPKHPSQLS